jgi:RNA polymerase sigma-70 factor (ECF subfamily)
MASRPSPFRRRECALRRARNDPDAFADFYDAYARRVLVFFMRRVMDAEAAFDLMSESFAKALENVSQFRGGTVEEEQGWLFAIARNELSHYWRRGKVERASLAKLGIPVPSLTDAEVERVEEIAGLSEVRQDIAEALDNLPDDQRRAVELRIVKEFEYPQVAESLGVSEDAARARVSRGLRALRAQIDTDDAVYEGIG